MNDTVLVLSAASAIVAGTPILLAALGEIIAERSGRDEPRRRGNDAASARWSGSGPACTPAASRWRCSSVGWPARCWPASTRVLAVSLRVNQTVSGLSLVIVGTRAVGVPRQHRRQSAARDAERCRRRIRCSRPRLRDLPGVGPILLGHDPVVYVSWILVAIAALRAVPHVGRALAAGHRRGSGRRRRGRAERACAPATSRPAIGGFGAGLGGAYLALAVLGTWQSGLTAGVGLDRRGARDPRRLAALAGAASVPTSFGALRGLGFTLQIAQVSVPADFLNMIPFIAAYLVVIVVSASPSRARRVAAPAALGKPYARESR